MTNERAGKGADAAWLSAGYLARAGAQAAIMIAFAWQGGPSGVGDFALAFAVSTPLFTLVEFGLRDIYQTLNPRPSLGMCFRMRLVGSLAAVLGSVGLNWFTGAPPLAILAPLVALKFADSNLDLFYGELLSLGLVRRVGSLIVANSVASSLFIALTLLLDWGAVTALALSACVSFAILLALVVPRFMKGALRLEVDRADWSEMIRIASPLGISQTLNSLLIYVPIFYLSSGASRAEAGTFAAAYYAVSTANLFFGASHQAWLSSLSRIYRRGDPSIFRAAAMATVMRLLILGIIGGLLVSMLLPWLVALVYGSEFRLNYFESSVFGLSIFALSAVTAAALVQLVINQYNAQLTSIVAAFIVVGLLAWFLLPCASVFMASCLVLTSFGTRAFVGLLQIWVRMRRGKNARVCANGPSQ